MEYIQRVWIMNIIVFSLNFLTLKEQNTERHFFVWAAKLNQHKGILTLKFECKVMLLWRRGSSFVFIEDENLWIKKRLMWSDGPKPLESLS